MQDLCIYYIRVRGRVDERAFNETSPLRVTAVADGEHPSGATLIKTCADQSGLVGLIRHLHGHGFVILSVCCEERSWEGKNETSNRNMVC